MTTQSWSERANGVWKLEILFDNENNATTGEFVEWVLLVHGTKEAPYKNQMPLNDKSKLAVAKSIHQNDFKDKERLVGVLAQDNQKRIGNSVEFERETKM
jgi:subtilisin-like proprotein convertase family protein